VLQPENRSWDVFPSSLEVDQSQALPRPAATMALGHLPVHVAASKLNFSNGELSDDSAVVEGLRTGFKRLEDLLLFSRGEGRSDGLLRWRQTQPVWHGGLEIHKRDAIPFYYSRVAMRPSLLNVHAK
jgi:hypothetical protein